MDDGPTPTLLTPSQAVAEADAPSSASDAASPLPSSNENQRGILGDANIENMYSCENVMINRLAGHDPELRKCVLVKLENWLRALLQRIPKSPGELMISEIQANFARIWKTLFCSIWVAAERQLPEVETVLLEPITSFVDVISVKLKVLQLYFEQFFVTLVQEWFWIESRKAEFIILIRIFLRKLFQKFEKISWDDVYVNSFLTVIDLHILNHHPPAPRSTRAASKAPVPIHAPSELQIHVVQALFGELKGFGPSTEKLIAPFVRELAESEDETLRNEIDIQIRMLLLHDVDGECDTESDNVEILGGTLEKVGLNDDKTADLNKVPGCDYNVTVNDVALLTLPIHYAGFLTILKEAAQKTSKNSNYKTITALVQKFQSYLPFGNDVPNTPISVEEKSTKNSKIKKEKKKKAGVVENEMDFTPMDSIYLNDPEILDHPFHNYISYLVEMEHYISPANTAPQSLPSPKSGLTSPPDTPVITTDVENVSRKLDFENSCPNGDLRSGSDTAVEMEESETKVITRKRKRATRCNDVAENHNVSSTDSPVTTKKKKLNQDQVDMDSSVSLVSATTNSMSEITQTSTFVSLRPSPFQKSVCFVLAKNLEHEHSDYKNSIERSPSIPFDVNKTPQGSGLLKFKSRPPSFWKKRKASYKRLATEADETY